MSRYRSILTHLLGAALIAAASCSTSKNLAEDEYLLWGNKVDITNSDDFPTSSLTPYIKQEATQRVFGIMGMFADPAIFDPSLVESSAREMEKHLEYEGYYNSAVTTSVSTKKQKATAQYHVKLGKRYPLAEIHYDIPDAKIDSILTKDRHNSLITRGQYLSEDILEQESERTARVLRNNGYYGLTKNYFFFTADTLHSVDSAILHVQLKEYTRNESPSMSRPHRQFKIGGVSIIPEKNLSVKGSLLTNLNRIYPTMPYSEDAINNTYRRFTSNRLFSTVNVQLEQASDSVVDCRILLAASKLQSVKLNLEGSFNSVGLLGITPSLSYSHKNIFKGGENLTVGFRGNFQFMVNDPVRSDEFAVTSTLSLPKFLLLPHEMFNGPTVPRTDFSLTFNYQSRPEYRRNIISSSYGYNWNNGKRTQFQLFPVQMNIVRIFDMDPKFFQSLNSSYLRDAYQNHFDIGSGGAVYYTTSPGANPQDTYFYLRFQGDVSGNVLSMLDGVMRKNEAGEHLIWGVPYAQYAKGDLSMVQTLRFGPQESFALAGRVRAGLGYAYGNSSALPMEKMFYGGGANSMRGWQSRTIGPGNSPLDSTFTIFNQTGDMLLEANLELRFPIVWKIGGALFADAGNIWNLRRESFSGQETIDQKKACFSFDNLLNSTSLSFGSGVRLDLGMLLIRVDLGLKGYDPATERWLKPSDWFSANGYALHFGIGYPF